MLSFGWPFYFLFQILHYCHMNSHDTQPVYIWISQTLLVIQWWCGGHFFINVFHHSNFSTTSSSSSLTWSMPSTASSSSSCSSRRRRCWRVCNDCGDEGGRRMEWKQCFRRPATSLSLSPAPSVVCQVCQSTVSSVKPRRCHKMLCELTWNDVWEWQKVFSLYMFNILIIQWNVYYANARHPIQWIY